MTTPKEAREAVRDLSRSCPCCGAALMVMVNGDERTAVAMQLLVASGARWALVRPEDAEAEIYAHDWRRVSPIGGRVE